MFSVLIFYATYVIGFFGSLSKNPVYAFVLYELVYFFSPKQRWWGYLVPDISYSFFVVILMIGLVFINLEQTKQNKLLKIPTFRWMYGLLFLYVVTSLYAVSPEIHQEFTINFLKLLVIMSVAYKLCDSDSKLNYVLWGYIFGSWYIGFLTFQVGRNAGNRVEGVGTIDSPEANGIAAAIAPSLVLCLYYFWTTKKWWGKALFMIAGLFIANGLVLINSRGAFIGVAVSLLYFMLQMYFSSTKRKLQKSMAIFLTVAGLAGGSMLIDKSFIERIGTMSNTEINEDKESGSTRIMFWIAAWEMAKDHPFGTGYRGFDHYATFYLPEDLNTGGSRRRSVHSSWFQALNEVGYLGLFAFVMMIFYAYRTLYFCKKELRKGNQVDNYFKVVALEAALLAYIVAMSFLNRTLAEVLYWLILYSACAYNIYVLKRPPEKSQPPLNRAYFK